MKLSDKIKKWITFALITLVCSTGIVILYDMKPVLETKPKKAPQLKHITVQEIRPGNYPVKISSFGEVYSKWNTTLRARAEGRITWINEKLQPGQQLKSGETILELDKTTYRAALAQANLELENARTNLIQVERQAFQAIADWQGYGIKEAPTSPLVFHEPQLKAARAQVAYAQKSIKKAENDLKQTRILAPYNGLIVERFADKGETLFIGDQVVNLISVDQIEIRINLDASQVKVMGNWQGNIVEVIDSVTGEIWAGKIIRDGGLLDRKTRLRCFYIAPLPEKYQTHSTRMIPGMFVSTFIHGQSQSNLLALPESSLTRDGDIWFVNRESRLERLKAEVAFYENGNVYIENSQNMTSMQVSTAPAPGFMVGTKVIPSLQGEG